MNDAELVREFKKGSKEAFSELVRRHSRPLTMMILGAVRDEEEAKDISQKTFLRAYQGLPRFMMASSFKTWLYAIAMNAIRDHMRKRSPDLVPEVPDRLPDPRISPEEEVERALTLKGVRKSIEELPHKQRCTVLLRVYEELEYREIAKILGGTAGAARGNFFQAMKTLRERLGTDT